MISLGLMVAIQWVAATFFGEPVGLKPLGCEIRTWIFWQNVDFCHSCKMEVNYDGLMMIELRALASKYGLRGNSRLRKAELIAFTPQGPSDKTSVTGLQS